MKNDEEEEKSFRSSFFHLVGTCTWEVYQVLWPATRDTQVYGYWLLVIGFFGLVFSFEGRIRPLLPPSSVLFFLWHDVVGSTIPYSRGPVRH